MLMRDIVGQLQTNLIRRTFVLLDFSKFPFKIGDLIHLWSNDLLYNMNSKAASIVLVVPSRAFARWYSNTDPCMILVQFDFNNFLLRWMILFISGSVTLI